MGSEDRPERSVFKRPHSESAKRYLVSACNSKTQSFRCSRRKPSGGRRPRARAAVAREAAGGDRPAGSPSAAAAARRPAADRSELAHLLKAFLDFLVSEKCRIVTQEAFFRRKRLDKFGNFW